MHHQLPGQPPAYAPPQKKRRVWLWLLLGIPLLLLLGIGGCSALVFRSVSGPLNATNEFVALLDEARFDQAYQSLCQASQAAIDGDDWATQVEADLGGEITGYSFTNTSVSSGNGTSTATVSGTIEVDGVDRAISYGLVQEGSQWRVCTADS